MTETDQPPTARERLFELHQELTKRSLALMKKKQGDYCTEEDPLANFRADGLQGMVVRLNDKVARLRNFARKGFFEVEDESVLDTALDTINYAVLYAFWVREAKK